MEPKRFVVLADPDEGQAGNVFLIDTGEAPLSWSQVQTRFKSIDPSRKPRVLVDCTELFTTEEVAS